MVSTITPLPDPPSRSTQDREAFVVATDNWLLGIQTWTVEVNTLAPELEGYTVSAQGYAASASTDAARAEAAAAFRVSFAFATWAELSAISGSYAGQSAGVYNDAGTHTDPVVGGTVANEGVYSWSVSPAGWKWSGTGASSAVDWASITGKPATFAPSAHTHAQSDITNLTTDLAAKAAVGAVGSSGLTMATARLLGRSTASTGAIEEITIGTGLSLSAGVLSYTGSTSMVYPASGIAVSTGSAWGASLTVPSGSLVGTTASQTLTNKTLGSGTTITTGTDSGLNKSGGIIQAGVTVSDTGTVTTTSPGYRGAPVQTATTRTLVAADNGKSVVATGTVTVPSGLPSGFTCIVCNNSGSSISIAQGSGTTMRLCGTATTGSRTLAQYDMCTVHVPTSNVTYVKGVT